MVVAVRGAVGIGDNTKKAIYHGVQSLITRLVETNQIAQNDIISIMFSQTQDLDAANPATALREIGFENVPLFCMQEINYKGSPPRIIRVLITFSSDKVRKGTPVYLDGAELLRPDLFPNGE